MQFSMFEIIFVCFILNNWKQNSIRIISALNWLMAGSFFLYFIYSFSHQPRWLFSIKFHKILTIWILGKIFSSRALWLYDKKYFIFKSDFIKLFVFVENILPLSRIAKINIVCSNRNINNSVPYQQLPHWMDNFKDPSSVLSRVFRNTLWKKSL